MVYTRLVIEQVEGFMSNFMKNPSRGHWEEVKWILKYVRGTTHSLNFGCSNTSFQYYVVSNM